MRILQVSTYDQGGGAEAVASQLLDGYRRRGHASSMLVGEKRTTDPSVQRLEHDKFHKTWKRWWRQRGTRLSALEGRRGVWSLRILLERCIADPKRWIDHSLGKDNFYYPATWHILDHAQSKPEILHCHNLHGGWLPAGGYFDLRALPWLSHNVPTVLTLHDAWLLSGHCAHSFECERWKTGCGACPDLTIYPQAKRDATAHNWTQKRNIFSQSRLYVSAPSRWLMQKAHQSMLSAAIIDSRVIPNGVNLTVFHPGDKTTARRSLGIRQDQKVVLFVAHGVRGNVWKNYTMMRAAIEEVGRGLRGEEVVFVALGEQGEAEEVGHAKIQFVPYTKDSSTVASYYQAADLYLHAARADTFPNTILEALASGVPVVATSVGGIPEQVQDGKTGFLVDAGNVQAMAGRILQLLSNDALRCSMAEAAAHMARGNFDLERQIDAYLKWYEQMLSARKTDVVAYAC